MPVLRRCARTVLAVAVALLGSGCEDLCGPDGSWTEVRTRHGTYDGYEVRAACASPADIVSVLGQGRRWSRDTAPGSSHRQQAFDDFADLVGVTLTARYRLFVDSQQQRGCANAEAVQVTLRDWRDLDQTVNAVGQLLKQGALREEVLIQIGQICPESLGYW